ncbi:hypothetical protein ISS42_00195 [Candidatus Shapirobacteria bacterium]|nr:hypothetical protein [Candidatus Shapirobacteria bacterium]
MNVKFDGFLDNFFALEIVPGKKIRIPYWRNKFFKNGKRIQGPFGGKGTPAQIKRASIKKAREGKISLNQLSSAQIRTFMKQKKIGLDCSGFTFQVLNFLKPGFYKRFKKAPGISPNPIRRFNARALTSNQNSQPVKKTKNIKVGDLIPVSFSNGKINHVLVVVEAGSKEIIYVHSSSRGKITGPHLGKIKIIDPESGLEKQHWLEKTKKDLNLLEFASRLLIKIGVRRVI